MYSCYHDDIKRWNNISICGNTAQSLVEDISIDKKGLSASQNPLEFTITPDSKEWKNYSSVQLKEMLNIPLSTAKKMDTAALLKTVLDYLPS